MSPETRKALRDLLPDTRDLLVFGGVAAATYGVWQLSEPAAWVFGGLLLFLVGTRS